MEQQFEYIGLGKQGFSTISMNEEQAFVSSYVYKKVLINHHQAIQPNQKFTDRNFDTQNINLKQFDDRQYTWVRLSTIVNGNLFKQLSFSPVNNQYINQISFFKQIRLLPIEYYKTLFTNCIINSQGFYKIILNINGIFQYVYIDDLIPANQQSLDSLFGLKFTYPWQILLLKAYSKILGGYQYLKNAQPFSFMKAVTFNNWRNKKLNDMDRNTQIQFLKQKLHGDITPNYLQESNTNVAVMTVASKIQQSISYQSRYNINHSKQNQNASRYFTNEAVVCSTKHSFTIIPKSKENPQLNQYGIIPNSSCYRITNIINIDGQDILRIQCGAKARWNGRFSIHDPYFQKYYSQRDHKLSIQKSFLMSIDDFKQIFSRALISPIDYQIPVSSNYSFQTVNLPQNCQSAQYFEFQIVTPGKYDISIVQPQSNLVDPHQQIHSFSALTTQKKIYPKVKILIGRRNQVIGQLSIQAQTLWDCVDASFNHVSESISTYFENLTAGRYMIRVKLQPSSQPLSYNIDIVSDSSVKLYWVDPPKTERSLFERSCFLTLAREKGDIFYLDSQTCQQWVSYGNSYNQIGYYFITFCSQQKSQYKLYCQIDQDQLSRQGFSLKFPYKGKGKNKLIGLFSEGGIAKTLVLKQKTSVDNWPPLAIRFYKVEI